MHAGILALIAGTPVLPIAYEFKTHELFARLGMAEWVQDIESVTGASLRSALDGFVEALPSLEGPLFEGVAREQALAREGGALVQAAASRAAGDPRVVGVGVVLVRQDDALRSLRRRARILVRRSRSTVTTSPRRRSTSDTSTPTDGWSPLQPVSECRS